MEYYLTIKRNKTEPFIEMWMDTEFVIQSEINKKEKSKYYILIHICGIYKKRDIKLWLGEGNGNPLQYSCLENPMDRGAW